MAAIHRLVQHRARWRREASLCLVGAGVMGLFMPSSDLNPLACGVAELAGLVTDLEVG